MANGRGEPARSLAMPALVDSAVGVKVINANPANPERGLPRASGVIVLFDSATARPVALLDAARISALRTAAVTVLAAELLGVVPLRRVALVGAGYLGATHLELIGSHLREVDEIAVHDIAPGRARALAGRAAAGQGERGARIRVAPTAKEAITGAELIVPVTTARRPYIRRAWIAPGALLVNVSLDDVLPEAILTADKLYVDDWSAVEGDRHRLLGRMAAAGTIRGPNGRHHPAARRVDAELGSVVIGTAIGR